MRAAATQPRDGAMLQVAVALHITALAQSELVSALEALSTPSNMNRMMKAAKQQGCAIEHHSSKLSHPGFLCRHAVVCRASKPGRGGSRSGNSKTILEPPPLTQAPDVSSSSKPTTEQPAIVPIVSPSLRGSNGASTAAVSTGQNQALKVIWRRILIDLSSLPRAIGLMAATFGMSALGTVIPQNKGLEYYMQNYPIEGGEKVLGFLSYDLITLLDLDHIYSAWYFYITLAWLAASLMACTSTRQWPAVKVAQRWRFQVTPVGVAKQGVDGKGVAEVLPAARIADLGQQLATRGYQVFVKGPSLYAFKGLAGKMGPIGVHAALLLILLGTSYSGFGGYKGTVMIPEGEDVLVGDVIRPVSPLASSPDAANKVLHVNRFSIDYRADGSVAQFYSDLSMLDPAQAPSVVQLQAAEQTSTSTSSSGQEPVPGLELLRKTISVNDPLRFGGLTMYQTDWSLSAVKLRVLDATDTPASASTSSDDLDSANTAGLGNAMGSMLSAVSSTSGTAITLPMGSLEGRPGINGRLWGSYLPVAAMTEEDMQRGKAPRGVSILARDPQSVIFYDSKGQFVGVRRPGSGKPIEVEGVQLVADAVVGATGLEIKSDPGVPLVYAGFGGLMVTTLVSYLSHSQVWALQEAGGYLYVGGRSNRATLAFQKEMNEVLDAIPEVPAAGQ